MKVYVMSCGDDDELVVCKTKEIAIREAVKDCKGAFAKVESIENVDDDGKHIHVRVVEKDHINGRWSPAHYYISEYEVITE